MSDKTKPTRTIGYSPWGHLAGNITPFEPLFTHKQDIVAEGFKGIDCLILWGGTDIHPSFYRDTPHPKNGAPTNPSERDLFEWKAMLYCKANDIPMIGVCRGAQFMCAFAGGSLAQHVERHGYDHTVNTATGDLIWITSSHHQMMNPFAVPHEMLAWTEKPTNKVYQDGEGKQIPEMETNNEPEIVYFPEIRALAIQGHPEYNTASPAFRRLCLNLARTKLFEENEVIS